jgi:hypothetical protein
VGPLVQGGIVHQFRLEDAVYQLQEKLLGSIPTRVRNGFPNSIRHSTCGKKTPPIADRPGQFLLKRDPISPRRNSDLGAK